MRVLVTGHLGYIGTVMVPVLVKAGHQVIGLDSNLYEQLHIHRGGNVAVVPHIRKDTRDASPEDFRGIDAVIHLAALSSAPELQKNACAPPNRADSASASAGAGSVPYRFDTCQRRSSWRCAAASGAGCLCPSATTAMRGEVEVPAAHVVGQPDAVALDERRARHRVGRQQRVVQHRAHAVTAVAPISATSPLRAARAAARTFGTIPPSNEPESTSAGACAALIDSTSSPSWKTPGTSVRKRILAQRRCQRRALPQPRPR